LYKALGSYVTALDNLSSIPPWFSDALCRAVTGDGEVVRKLYTDSAITVFRGKRTLIVNGIGLGAQRGDLAERMVLIELAPLEAGARRSESELTAAWQAVYPSVLGGLLDLATEVLAARVPADLRRERMADYCEVLAKIDALMGTDGLDNYRQLLAKSGRDGIDGNSFLTAMVETLTGRFVGTAKDLLARVTFTGPPPSDWPDRPRAASDLLKRAAPSLRRNGWTVGNDGGANKNGTLIWTINPPA
jgi:hypothetical protein